jgi:hypothetical protein
LVKQTEPELVSLCAGWLGVSPSLRLIRRKVSLEIIKSVSVLVIFFVVLFSPTLTWSQTQATQSSNPPAQVSQAQQSQNPASQSKPAPPQGPQDKKKKKDDTQATQSKRMFGVVPNFGAVDANAQLPPMSTRDKFVLASKDSVIDYSSYTWAGILAGQSMLMNSDPELGHGIAGYGRYYWRAFTDGVSGTFFTEAIVPTLTREDPRYYTLGKGGFFHRTGYAISRAFVTKTDSGGNAFNWSEVGGNALEAGLSNAYYPPQERGPSQTAVNFGVQMESAVLNHVFQEFWPDIRKNVFHRK